MFFCLILCFFFSFFIVFFFIVFLFFFLFFIFFFFSSRRRHTRYWRDWSSDVCSSDLDSGRGRSRRRPRRRVFERSPPAHARSRAAGACRTRRLRVERSGSTHAQRAQG